MTEPRKVDEAVTPPASVEPVGQEVNRKARATKDHHPLQTEELLRVLIAIAGRAVFPEDQLKRMVTPRGNANYLLAYNLCDGRTPLAEIARIAKIDRPTLHKAALRWVEAGIMFRTEREGLFLNLYLISLTTFDDDNRSSSKSAVVGDSQSQ